MRTRGTPRSVIAHIEGEADARRTELREPRNHLLRLFGREAADHHALDPAAQQILDDGRGAHAAADLDPDGRLRGEPFDDGAIGERAVARAVQIDDVQPARAKGAIALQQLLGREVVARLGGEIALEQAHAAAVAQIDGGNQQHVR